MIEPKYLRCLSSILLAAMIPLLAGCEFANGWNFSSGPTVTATFHKAEAVPENVIVEIRNGSGDTVVYGAADRQVSVDGKINVRAGRKETADRILAEVSKNPPVRFEGARVVIGELDRSAFESASVWIDFTVSMPRGGSLSSKTGSGDQEVRDISSRVEVTTGSGDIKATNIGDSIRAKAGSGDITVRDIRGDADLGAGSGDIAADNLGGRTQISTSSGDIRIGYAIGELQAHTSSGSLQVREAKAGMRLRASSGDIEVQSLLVAGSSWELDSSSGDIDLLLPAASQFNLDANSHGGETVSDFSLTSTERSGKGMLRGAVGQSSSWVRISSNNGRIRLRKN